MATVYIIDDDASVRESVLEFVRSAGMRGVGFSSAEEFLEEKSIERPCCVLLDVVLGGMSGIELQQHLKQYDVTLPVVVISGYADVSIAVRAMEAGALTLIEKPCSEPLLSNAINRAIEWDKQRVEVDRLIDRLGHCEASLTNRERQVLQQVLAGRPNKSIANMLEVSERTIEGDRAKILKKFDSDNAVELAAKFTKYKVLSGQSLRFDSNSEAAPESMRLYAPRRQA